MSMDPKTAAHHVARLTPKARTALADLIRASEHGAVFGSLVSWAAEVVEMDAPLRSVLAKAIASDADETALATTIDREVNAARSRQVPRG